MATANEPTPQEVVFDDLNYEAWAPIMKATLVERGLWDVVENVAPPNPLSMPELAATIQAEDLSPWRDFVVKDTKAIHILQCSVPDSVFRQTLDAASAKDLWDLLQESNEQAKLQKDFEQLQIDFRERFSSYIDIVLKISTDPLFADTKSKFQATTKLISLSDSYDGAVPVGDQLMTMQNLSFSRLLLLLDMFESLPVETFDKLLKVLEVGSSSDCEVITKLFTSLSDSCDDDNLQTFNRLRKHLGVLESLPADAICRMLKRQKEVGAVEVSLK